MHLTFLALLLAIVTSSATLTFSPKQQGNALLVTGETIALGEADKSSSEAQGFLYPGGEKEDARWRDGFFSAAKRKEFHHLLHKSRDWIYNMGYAKLPSWSTWFLHVTMSWVIFMLLCLLVWINAYPDDPDLDGIFADKEKADPVQILTEDHFGCFKTPKICLFACVCPALRWADNVNMAGFLRVQVALGLFFVCALANGMTGTFCYTGLVTCCLILYYRHKLRAKLGIPAFTWRSCCSDFFFVFCCSWCAIAQEARVVRYAYQQGTLSLTTGKRYGKSELPDRPFPRMARSGISAARVLLPPPEPAPLAAQRLVA